ncbi:hypothetical protein I7I51_07646 [Histoplasma capsulatum]|uniref:Uncharacterized protein n=1 Tax=Ajellomyces capsulatus TaxID=5037 RepID=A0A8A1M0A3_AJECA|nr:hypothetical protein I7I51_07646 [Histoplasma capsulatum]
MDSVEKYPSFLDFGRIKIPRHKWTDQQQFYALKKKDEAEIFNHIFEPEIEDFENGLPVTTIHNPARNGTPSNPSHINSTAEYRPATPSYVDSSQIYNPYYYQEMKAAQAEAEAERLKQKQKKTENIPFWSSLEELFPRMKLVVETAEWSLDQTDM